MRGGKRHRNKIYNYCYIKNIVEIGICEKTPLFLAVVNFRNAKVETMSTENPFLGKVRHRPGVCVMDFIMPK